MLGMSAIQPDSAAFNLLFEESKTLPRVATNSKGCSCLYENCAGTPVELHSPILVELFEADSSGVGAPITSGGGSGIVRSEM
jgi:hypothetical protein